MDCKVENVIEITWIIADHINKRNFSCKVFPFEELKEFICKMTEAFEATYSGVDWNELDYINEIVRFTNVNLAKELWQRFGDVPMNPETEEIEEEWNGFPIGTWREYIWHWFEETFDISVAKDLMGV